MNPVRVLESYTIMMGLGLLLGLLTGGFPWLTKEISMASLALVMTFSLSGIKLGEARGRDHISHSLKALVINYLFLTGLILCIGLFFSGDYRIGWVLMAAAPSAISVVPFTRVLGGETSKALFSTAVNYFAALALMPLIALLLTGSSVSSTDLVYSVLLLIVLPMAASRAVTRMNISKSANTSIMNLGFAVLIFAVTGANRDAFVAEAALVILMSVGCILRTFGSGLGTEFVLRKAGVPKSARISYVLFASYKNLGLTATLAIALFVPEVAMPATVGIVFEVVWVLFLIRYYPGVPE